MFQIWIYVQCPSSYRSSIFISYLRNLNHRMCVGSVLTYTKFRLHYPYFLGAWFSCFISFKDWLWTYLYFICVIEEHKLWYMLLYSKGILFSFEYAASLREVETAEESINWVFWMNCNQHLELQSANFLHVFRVACEETKSIWDSYHNILLLW